MRILKGYTVEEEKEFKELNVLHYPLSKLSSSSQFTFSFPRLNSKLTGGDEWKFLTDLTDYHNENAKFPEKLYYVKFVAGVESYLNVHRIDGHVFISNENNTNYDQTIFTIPEIKAINENYVPFAVPVDEVEK